MAEGEGDGGLPSETRYTKIGYDTSWLGYLGYNTLLSELKLKIAEQARVRGRLDKIDTIYVDFTQSAVAKKINGKIITAIENLIYAERTVLPLLYTYSTPKNLARYEQSFSIGGLYHYMEFLARLKTQETGHAYSYEAGKPFVSALASDDDLEERTEYQKEASQLTVRSIEDRLIQFVTQRGGQIVLDAEAAKKRMRKKLEKKKP